MFLSRTFKIFIVLWITIRCSLWTSTNHSDVSLSLLHPLSLGKIPHWRLPHFQPKVQTHANKMQPPLYAGSTFPSTSVSVYREKKAYFLTRCDIDVAAKHITFPVLGYRSSMRKSVSMTSRAVIFLLLRNLSENCNPRRTF